MVIKILHYKNLKRLKDLKSRLIQPMPCAFPMPTKLGRYSQLYLDPMNFDKLPMKKPRYI